MKFIKGLVFLAFIAIVILPIYTLFYLSPAFTTFIAHNTEHEAVRVANHLSELAFPSHQISRNLLTEKFKDQITTATNDFGLMKVKVFTAFGEVIYSSDPTEIGTINRKNYFHEIVATGKNLTKIVKKDSMSMENQLVPLDVVETYIPIMRNNKFMGAFEIYYDITASKNQLDKLITKFYSTLFPIAICLMLAIAITMFKGTENIKDKILAEEKLQANEDRFRSIFEESNDAIIIFNLDGEIQDVNIRSCQTLGYGKNQLCSMNIKDLLVIDKEEDSSQKILDEIIKMGQTRFETKIRKEDDIIVNVAISARVTNELRGTAQAIIRDITDRKKSEEEIKRNYQTQTVLNKLLHLSLENISLEKTLELFIYYITSFPWLVLEPKGAIFLTGSKPGILELKAHRGLNDSLLKICAQVPFGKCLCGKSALSGEIVFANCVDEFHDNTYAGIAPHGHYCVPILSASKKVIGVYTLYTKSDCQRDKQVEDILQSAANVISGIIQLKQAEEELQNSRDELEVRVQDRTVELEEMNQQLEQELQVRRETEKALTKSKLETEWANTEKDQLILNLFEIMYEMLANRDHSTFEHALRVSEISKRIGLEMALSTDEMDVIKHGCLVHDIGKVAIPDDILLKPGLFDRIDRKIMQVHTLVGASLFSRHHHDERIRRIILHHHERLDGSGYPKGLKGDEIGLLERIVAVADVYEALISKRPYKHALSRKKALDILNFEVKEGRLDGKIVDIMKKVTETWSPLEITSSFKADYTVDLEVFRQMTYFKEPLSDFYNYRYLLYLDDANILKRNRSKPYHIIMTNFPELREFNHAMGFVKADQVLDEIGQKMHQTSEDFNTACSKDENAVILLRKNADFIIYSECVDEQLKELLSQIVGHLQEATDEWGLKSEHAHHRFEGDYPTEKALNEIFSAAT
ncbi:MAG: PAS domain S-box protein [Proteobacteria bacterium]|nr:PAS domain S-box protein [Pseudomonadota bacterium]